MAERVSTYRGKSVEITYDRARCIHAAECGRGSKTLFDATKDPWCDPDAVSVQEAFAVVARCPSGALQIRPRDGSPDAPKPSTENIVSVSPDGPLYAQGEFALAGATENNRRLALCRCGASSIKPFCDGSHAKIGFKDSGAIASDPKEESLAPGPLKMTPAKNGPLVLEGPVSLRSGSGREAFRGRRVALCRCGGSKNKPFCDGSHSQIGFEAD